MGLFTPYKKSANRFSYIPRFYDPVKEAREQRRRELRGESVETDNAEYTPGMYLRTQRDARAERRRTAAAGRNSSKSSAIVVASMVALFILFAYMLYPRIIELFSAGVSQRAVQQPATEEFDPYAPIVIVPNDYQE